MRALMREQRVSNIGKGLQDWRFGRWAACCVADEVASKEPSC